ncbi:unnamed protein product [Moneuplotes crassus]|uniref:Uncharacterized protein n=1 Tax=Euplotes crassus TaxID=5936 RepID=A0AAD1X6P4_EUPCR|nr:unnamed protein product [Moneuplotes crassus]
MESANSKRVKRSEFKESEVLNDKMNNVHLRHFDLEDNPDGASILSGKERARIHRKRKKLYYEGLESENKTLKLKIGELEQKIESLEKALEGAKDNPVNNAIIKKLSNSAFSPVKLPEISNLIKLKMSEEFKYEEFPKMVQENPTKVKDIKVETIDDSVGIYGKERIQYLKDQFKNIIDNIVPFEIKICLLLFDHIPLSKFLRMVGGSRNKFMERKTTGNQILDLIIQTEMSDEIYHFLKEKGKEFTKNIQMIRKLVRSLVHTRNKIFQLLKQCNSEDAKKLIFKNYNMFPYTDRTKVAQLATKIKEMGGIDDFKVWKIDKRSQGDEYTSDIQLSE